MRKAAPRILAALLVAFALLTLFLSGSVIFDLFGIRAKEGNYVLFVVWANFISSLLYLAAAYGLVSLKKWPYQILIVAVAVLFIAFAGLLVHISRGGLHETKTIGAMVFRICVTLAFAFFCYRQIKKGEQLSKLFFF
ncbi:hypothetical protein [Gaoshiqia sediminis]|uniref:Uncharacterized protein n=1 Tax=Gaoshiqia sediminis TaxID=2986998 RepID=A0AA41Y7H8_9BACT|nr:hypothetical protein [Gaoshiqia sediminis]MCW0482323.1 hypothetical protein [Gaoshiqia sediminis]